MYRKLCVIATAAAMLVISATAASGFTSPNWNLNGTYTIPFTETVGPDAPGPYPYSVTITVTSDITGEVSGSGYYITGGGYPAVTVTGQVTGWDVTLELLYTDPALASYNPFVLVGTIDQYGGMSGTASDGRDRQFTWLTTTGTVSLFGSCPEGAVFVPATGATVFMDTIPGHNYLLEASGTFFAGGNGTFDIQADAEYSQDAIQRAADPDADWTDAVNNYGNFGEELLDLQIDGVDTDWGAYDPSHTYTLQKVAPDSALSFTFGIWDVYYPNNAGGLCVSMTDLTLPFTGFFRPVDNLPTFNLVKAGQAIPVKFSLDGDRGLDIFAAGYPKSHQINCDTGGDLDAIEVTVTAGGSSLGYDAFTDTYTYVWDTAKSWSGTCRQLSVMLNDGSSLVYAANFKFK